VSHVWLLDWSHGEAALHSIGGMLGGVKLRLGDRWVSPFYEAPWLSEGKALSPTLLEDAVPSWRRCLSKPEPHWDLEEHDHLLHGYGAVAEWSLVRKTNHEIVVEVDYPEPSPIRRLERSVRCVPGTATMEFLLTVEARRRCRRPLGLHPNLSLPHVVGAFHIDPGPFQFGLVHPAGPERGVSRAAAGGSFQSLAAVPLLGGGHGSFDRLPVSEDSEEILQLCGVPGPVVLINDEVGAKYRLSWDASVLPALLLWISNRGRRYAPWDGRNVCLGVEPIAAAFDLGCAASLAANPINEIGIPTSVEVTPEKPLTIHYRFEAEPT